MSDSILARIPSDCQAPELDGIASLAIVPVASLIGQKPPTPSYANAANLYAFSWENTVLYVGSVFAYGTYNAWVRVRRGHVGRNQQSPVSKLIWSNRPESEKIAVEFLAAADRFNFENRECSSGQSAERVLIRLFQPCLNRTGVKFPTPLPRSLMLAQAVQS